jgi:thiol:disulfide interchange protein
MHERYEKIEYATLFSFGLLGAVVYTLLIHGYAVLGLALGIFVAVSAIFVWQKDIAVEFSALKVVPEKLAVIGVILYARIALAYMRLAAHVRIERKALEERMHKAVREMRQTKLLKRNRTYRMRRVLSA